MLMAMGKAHEATRKVSPDLNFPLTPPCAISLPQVEASLYHHNMSVASCGVGVGRSDYQVATLQARLRAKRVY